MPYETDYIPDQGNAIYSASGYQRITSLSYGVLNYSSKINTDISIYSKWHMSDCWETGDLYYINGATVYKIKYDGTVLSSLALTNPVSLATIQSNVPMPIDTENFGVDNGCWIVDSSTKKLILTDSDLVLVNEITNFEDPSYVISSPDGGCYVFDDGREWLLKVASDASVDSFILYSDLPFSVSSDVDGADTDINNGLWFTVNGVLYQIAYDNGAIELNALIATDIATKTGASVVCVGDISVEKFSTGSEVYVCGCSDVGSWVAKFDLNGKISDYGNYGDGDYFSLIQVSQWGGSNSLYIVSESENIPNECII